MNKSFLKLHLHRRVHSTFELNRNLLQKCARGNFISTWYESLLCHESNVMKCCIVYKNFAMYIKIVLKFTNVKAVISHI